MRFNIKNAPTNNSAAETIKTVIKSTPKLSPSSSDGTAKAARCSAEQPAISLSAPFGVSGQRSSPSRTPSPSESVSFVAVWLSVWLSVGSSMITTTPSKSHPMASDSLTPSPSASARFRASCGETSTIDEFIAVV